MSRFPAPGGNRRTDLRSHDQYLQTVGRGHATPVSRNASSYTASTEWTIAGIPNLAPILWLAAAPSSLAQSGRDSNSAIADASAAELPGGTRRPFRRSFRNAGIQPTRV